ncbi:hypothetical protein [Lysinibacillus sp. FSL K6-0102]|uniref:hypothetical protein n=1 Tax=Lysinibacillus sp. FSL K6-0102 TaxID=2975290 RepID=UPI0030FA6C54
MNAEDEITATEAGRRLSKFAESLGIDEKIFDEWNNLDNVSFTMGSGNVSRTRGTSGDGFLKGKQMSKVLGKR